VSKVSIYQKFKNNNVNKVNIHHNINHKFKIVIKLMQQLKYNPYFVVLYLEKIIIKLLIRFSKKKKI